MLGIDDINRLEKENEQLKKEAALNAVCIANYIKKVKKQDKLIAKIQNDYNNRKPAAQYIKTLEDIKHECKQCIEYGYPDYYDEGFEEDIAVEFAKKILDKVNEVLDGTN